MKKFIGITLAAAILLSLALAGVAFAADNGTTDNDGPGYCWQWWQNNQNSVQSTPAAPAYGGYYCHGW